MKLDARQIFPIAVSTVASSAALLLPVGRIFSISGTTNITSITSTNFTSGDIIILVFEGVLTFTNGNNLILFGNFVTAANYTITLFYNGSNWIECSRTSGSGTAALTTADKKRTPEVTIQDNNDTGLSITNTPNADGYVICSVNGLITALGDGATTGDCYFQPGSIHSFSAVSAGGGFEYGLKADGSIWTWGANTNGTLGINSTDDKSSPVSVVGAHSFVLISAGANISGLAMKSDGSVWSCGSGASGRLGDGTIISRSSPVSLIGGHSFVTVVASSSGGVGIKSDGSIWTWGTNTTGQLGDNTLTNRSSPVSVVGGHSFIAVSGGSNCVMGLKSNGSVWCFGTGTSGQMGDNTATTKSSPVSVVGGHSFTAIAAGANFNAGLKGGDGSVWCWGLASSGQLGDNQTTTNRSSPVSVVGAHSFDSISLGQNAIALKNNNGSAWGWGTGTSGQLGDNTATSKSSPVSVVGGHSFITIDAGATANIGLKSTNIPWIWGANTSGDLGDRTTANRSSPISVYGRYPIGAVRNISAITAGDDWWWNGVLSGYNLSITDKVDFNYLV